MELIINKAEPRDVSTTIENLTNKPTIFNIIKDDIIVGDLEVYKMDHDTLYLLQLNIIDSFRKEGIAKATIDILIELDGITKIYGEAVPEAYGFFKHINADLEFDKGLDEIEDYIESGYTIPFTIYKEDFYEVYHQ